VARVAAGLLHVCYDERILDEYRLVLHRPKFGFDISAVTLFLDQLQADGAPVVCQPLQSRLPDADDEKFLEAALAGEAEYLVTGNLRHFPRELRAGILVVTPREFIELVP
jgi:predicted nucleic acid-binding protein